SQQVSAHGQSGLLEKLIPLFNEEETDIYKRGRNAKKSTKSKNASVAEYNRSTGFEAVIGYLYLTGQYKRIEQLLDGKDEN
ncbi:MAG: ribonuclease III, partial [Clostridia bacterium]|nr:ribonuclease III [Clostridia bacterium]